MLINKPTTILFEPRWIRTPGDGEPGSSIVVFHNDTCYRGHITQAGRLLGDINDLPLPVTRELTQLAFCEEPGKVTLWPAA